MNRSSSIRSLTRLMAQALRPDGDEPLAPDGAVWRSVDTTLRMVQGRFARGGGAGATLDREELDRRGFGDGSAGTKAAYDPVAAGLNGHRGDADDDTV